MNQSIVTIRLNGHPYQIGCGEGEENHVAKLGDEVEARVFHNKRVTGRFGSLNMAVMI